MKRKFKNIITLLFLIASARNIFSMKERNIVEDYQVWNSFSDVKKFAKGIPSFPDAFLKDDSLQSLVRATEIEGEDNPIPLTSAATILMTFPQFLNKNNTPKELSDIRKAIGDDKIVLVGDKIIADDFFKTYTDFSVLGNLLQDTTKILDAQCNNIHENGDKFFTKAIPVDENAVIHSMGACHGGFHSLVEFLNSAFYSQDQTQESPYEENSFKLKEKFKNHHWVLGGNFTACGRDSTESLRLLSQVFKNNPDNIHLIRGLFDQDGIFGLNEELVEKFHKQHAQSLLLTLNNFYRALPLGIWFVYENGSVVPYFSSCINQKDTGIVNLLENCLNNKKVTYKTSVVSESKKLQDILWRPNPNSNEENGNWELSQKTILNFIKSIYLLSNNQFKIKQINCSFQEVITGFASPKGKSFIPILLENLGMCDLWGDDFPVISILPPAPSSSFGVPFYYKGTLYKIEFNNDNIQILKLASPGIVRHITGCTYIDKDKNELQYDYVELPNQYLSNDILEKHKEILSKILDDIDQIIENQNFYSTQRDNLKMMIEIAKKQQKRMNITRDNLFDDLRTENPKIRYTKSLGEKEFEKILKLIGTIALVGHLKDDKVILVEQGRIENKKAKNVKNDIEIPDNLNPADIINFNNGKNPKEEKNNAKNLWFWQKHPYCTGFGVLSLGTLLYFLVLKKYFRK